MASTSSGIDARLTGAETSIKSLEQIVGDLARTMSVGFQRTDEQLAKAADNTDRKLSEIERAISAGGRTPWNVIFSGAGVAVAVLVALGGLAGASWVNPLAITVTRNTGIIDNIQGGLHAIERRISDLASTDAAAAQWRVGMEKKVDEYGQTRATWPMDLARLDERLKMIERGAKP